MKKENKATKTRKSLLSLNMISTFAFIFFVLFLTNAMYFGQQEPIDNLQRQQNLMAMAESERAALILKGQVDEYSIALRGLSMSPEVQTLLIEGTQLQREEYTAAIKSQFPHALSLRMIEKGMEQPNSLVTPHVSYACVDLMKETVRRGKHALTESHAFGNDQQHVDMIQPVYRGDELLGYLQLNLDVKILQMWLNKTPSELHVELRQNVGGSQGSVLVRAGQTSSYGYNAQQKIPGTQFVIEAWTPSVVRGSAFNTSMMVALLAAIFLSGIMVVVLRGLLRRSIRHDIENFMETISNRLRGKKNMELGFRLAEFRDALELIDNLRVSASRGSVREKDLGQKKQDAPSPFKDRDLSNVPPPPPSISVDELDSLEEPQEAKIPELPAEIFKAYDIRGIVGKTLTPEFIHIIGQALASEAIDRGLKIIIFGRDGRLSGPELGKALIEGMQSTGLQVIDIGMVPTPMLYYAAHELSNGTGVMLTGSHNPPEYNGLKMMLGGETLSGEMIQKLRERIRQGRLRSGQGSYAKRDVLNDYLKRIIESIRMERRLKVVVDCGNGVAAVAAEKLFAGMGCEVIPLYCEVDGKFPNHHPDPSQPENLADTIAAVRQHGADLGLAFDGDGDRLGVISSDGRVIWPDRLMMLFAKDILSRNPGAEIIYDIKCSSNLGEEIKERGGVPVMWKTGHSFIKAKMKESGALLAGEMSGHLFFKERWYGFDDALYAAARLLEILSNDLRQPRVVFSNLPDSVNTPELKIPVPEGQQHVFIETLVSKSNAFPDAEVSLIDGIRVDYADSWGLVRASNTTPCLVLRFEGRDKAAMGRVQEKFREVLLGIKPDLPLPF